MEFNYSYGPEDAEQYQFYRIPKLLITSERFKDWIRILLSQRLKTRSPPMEFLQSLTATRAASLPAKNTRHICGALGSGKAWMANPDGQIIS